MLTELAAFVGVSAVVICTPGPDTALTVRNALAGGRRSGVMTAIGVSAGQAIWAVSASVGIAALIAASEPAFLALRFAGATYLVFLGLQAVYSALFRSGRTSPPRAGSLRIPPAAAVRQGVVSNLSNPKMAAFFTSLLPQFAPGGVASVAALLGLGLLFSVMTLAWLTAYALVVAKTRQVLTRTRVRRALDAITGTVLVGFGLRLATEHR